MISFFTSITANYLAKARVLGYTLKKYNPECKFYLGLSDNIPDDIVLNDEPFDDIILTDQLQQIDKKDNFFFKHTVTEVCTAVKPALALTLIEKYNAKKVVYLDPDIMVFHDFDELDKWLDQYSILLTPHQLEHEDYDSYVVSNEILFLKRGTYNCGFFAVKADEIGIKFLNWWNLRLMDYCFDDDYALLDLLEPNGLLGMFTDQKWVDLVPAYFDNYKIIKKHGYNVSTWNMTKRTIREVGNGQYEVDGDPLIFFHFSGYDSQGHRNELLRSLNYNSKNQAVIGLSESYGKETEKNGQRIFQNIKYKYSYYSNGEVISKNERKILHMRKDVKDIFSTPFCTDAPNSFYKWVREEYGKYVSNSGKNRSDKEKNIIVRNRKISTLVNFLFPSESKRRKIVRYLIVK